MNSFKDLFENITERFSVPVKLSKSCESNTFYRVEDLTREDVEFCAEYLAEKIIDSGEPDILIEMPGSAVDLGKTVADKMGEQVKRPDVILLEGTENGDINISSIQGKTIVIINDVITTGRSCLEVHSKLTMKGGNVLCWVALVDRTFGPGPVSVIATLTGDSITLLK